VFSALKPKNLARFGLVFSVTKDEPLRLSCVTPLGLENAVKS